MVEIRTGFPVSGEILTVRSGSGQPHASDDVIDAEYETVARCEGAPAIGPKTPASIAVRMPGIDMLLGAHAGEEPGRAVFWVFAFIFVAATFLISGGYAVVPQAFSEREPARPLRISGVESRLEEEGGRKHLVVAGEAVNDGARGLTLPDLSIDVLDGGGRKMHYFLGTKGTALEAGGRIAFSSRLPPPKDGVKSVSVTFREYTE